MKREVNHMKRIKTRIFAVLLSVVVAIGITPIAAYAVEDYDISLQYEQQSMYMIDIPSIVDVSYPNRLSLSYADLADDKEVYVSLKPNCFNASGKIEMAQVNNSSNTTQVTLTSQEYGTLNATNNLLCTFSNESMESTEFWGQAEDDARPGKYRAAVRFEVGLRDRTTTESGT